MTYNGKDYFWAYEYRHPMRDLTPAGRKRVHAKMIEKGLSLSGQTARHKAAIFDALTSYDRKHLRKMYGKVAWAWWEKS